MTSAIDTIDDHDVVDQNAGPCTEEEARELVREVAEAAVRFEDAMQQIFRRRAWEPLGYANPQDLILGEFKDGGLINPRTGKPYGRAHIYRMARTALFLHEVASRTGVDATELDVAEKALRAARENGVDDVTMLTQIEDRVIEATENGEQPDGDAVQEIVDSVIAESAGRAPAPSETTDDMPAGASAAAPDASAAPVGGPEAPASAPASSGPTTAADDGDDPTDWPNADPHHERDTTGDDVNIDDPFGGFGAQAAGSMAPEGGVSWAAALAGADDFIRFTDTLRYINDVGRKLPEVSEVRDKLPEFLDACDDSELNAFSEALDDLDLLLQDIPQIREAIRAIQECTDERAAEL
ncbi:hypothetical protein [Prescottella agglutinans]|uniref:Uncharacterized protein n=1 Tax=Prescottella agglutinans TaxID=1644129 RepID=A0ABT6MJ13_9NOCA|nr:hypothetical protein [Prescottella agglutinans]MDH6284313.1 hypothetical protein [Prescottella agglutinans]